MYKIHPTLFLLQLKQVPQGRVWENPVNGMPERSRIGIESLTLPLVLYDGLASGPVDTK